MALVRSLLFALVFLSVTILLCLVALPLLPLPRWAIRAEALAWVGFYRWATRTILGIDVRIEGRLPEGAAFVVAKHESMYETMLLTSLLGGPRMILKRELTLIPILGWAIRRYGAIPVDRAGSAKALKAMVAAARGAAADRQAILLFPEGTRVAPGEAPPLRAGFAALYRAIGLPVVPVAVDSGRLWTKGLVKHPGTITLRFAEPIDPGLPRREVEARAHAAINALNASPRR